jgi:hypothetical protein
MSALQELDLTDLDPATIAALEECARREHLLLALQEQAAQEQLARECREMNAVNGLGQVTRNISAFAFHDWALKERSYDCWADKGFNRYIDRLAPETKVKCVAPNSGNGLPLQVGWTPPNAPRFSKSYGDGRAPLPRGPDSITARQEPRPAELS